VYIPERKREILDRGPFYAYLVPGNGRPIVEGRPLPAGTIRLGTFDIEPARNDEIELSVAFTIPDVPSGSYGVQLCNDPCTVAGFREPQTGSLTVAATQTEANLMRERDRLSAEIYGLKRRLKKADRQGGDLQTQLAAAVAERDADAVRISALEAAPAASATSASADEAARPLVDGWALVALGAGVLVALTAIGIALVVSRPRRPQLDVGPAEAMMVDDAIEEGETPPVRDRESVAAGRRFR